MDHIVSLCKRRGFVFPSSEIYGGFSATYDYGPYGVLLKNNIKNIWWELLVKNQEDVVGLDSAIFSHPKTWEASGHLESFTDPLVEDKNTHERLRADHVIEDYCDSKKIDDKELSNKHLGKSLELSELTAEQMGKIINEEKIKSPSGNELTAPKVFNLLVEARLGATEETKSCAYLRGETCQAIFLQYKNVLKSMRKKIPFGIAQMGKAFRNEITTKQFLLRTREFEQMEFEYFVDPDESFAAYNKWEKFFVEEFLVKGLNISSQEIRLREIPPAERSHYAKAQKDFEIKMSSGKWLECSPMNHRGDWDLSRHGQYSGESFIYKDDKNGKEFIPNVIETSFGVDRLFYLILEKGYKEENLGNGEMRTVLALPFNLAPIKIAIFPLVKNKPELVKKARNVFDSLKSEYVCEFDDNGNIGKRYRRQDEVGTPFCITVDYDTLNDETVTIRNRDTMKQERISIDKIASFVKQNNLL
jgi:glycyl-tRNA synthetase